MSEYNVIINVPQAIKAVVQPNAVISAIVNSPHPVSSSIQVGQGPAGPPGISEEDQVYSKRLDMVSPGVFYKGESAVGSLESELVWRIRKITVIETGNLIDSSEQWAEGTSAFTHAWDQRTLLTYI